MGKDKYGNYVNDEGVTIKANRDKKGNSHISYYDGDVSGKHSGTHINIDYDKKTVNIKKHNEDGSEKSSSIIDCYLTTACMKHDNEKFDDNCYELRVLRWFRDNFVTKEDIEHYYKTAPYIVEGISREEKQDLIYDYIYDNIVDYCVEKIEKGNYEEAYTRYKESILSLEETFARPVIEQNLVKTLKTGRR